MMMMIHSQWVTLVGRLPGCVTFC